MIDGGALLGKNPATGQDLHAKELLQFMDRHGIAQTVVASSKSIYLDFRQGNEEILKTCRQYSSRLIPAVFVQPVGFDVSRDADYFRKLREKGARILAVWTEPHYYEINLESPLLQKITAMAEEAGLVIQFGIRNSVDLGKISQFYKHLSGPVLIRWTSGRGYQTLSEVLCAAETHKNFYFDCASFTSCGTIKQLAGTIGSERLFFSSGLPDNLSYTAHFLIQTAGLTRQELSNIYSATLNRVLFNKKSSVVNLEKWSRLIDSLVRHPKIDTHWHTDGWNIIEPCKDFSKIETELKTFNIRKSVFSAVYSLNYDIVEGNRRFSEVMKKNPNVYGLIVVDPTKVKKSEAEIKKYADHARWVGLKTIQDLYAMSLNDKNYHVFFHLAQKYDLPVMAHIPGMLEAAKQFPGVRFLCAHSTLGRVKHMMGTPNIWFDIATSHHDRKETSLDELFEQAGADRIVFSSDAPLISPAWTLGKLAETNLTPHDLKKIFLENALTVFPKLQTSHKKGRRS